MLRSKEYGVDIDTGKVYGQSGNELCQRIGYEGAEDSEKSYLTVELYSAELGKRVNIFVHKLVWMAATNHTIPKKFQVHHFDEEPVHNWFKNLLCCHTADHAKFHDMDATEETPF